MVTCEWMGDPTPTELENMLVNQEPDLVAEITGMLSEMDNSELLLLLESPESLAARVEEAAEVSQALKNQIL
ncbi:hypothetical protein NL676_018129 [Syzygium grande]|nr:hypothetical protein NL676_018129 [Syzygium grande]